MWGNPRRASVVLVVLAGASGGQDQEPVAGWVSRPAGLERVIARAPMAAFALAEGQTLHPDLPVTATEITYATALSVPLDGAYRFRLEVEGGTGSLQVTPGMETPFQGSGTTDWVALERGDVLATATFQGEGGGPRRFRVLWELNTTDQGGFPLEPIPSSAASPSAIGLASTVAGRPHGRVLLSREGCTNCHAPREKERFAVRTRPAPELVGVGERISAAWIRRWIADPAALKPGADMPRLFADDEGDAVEAVVHYLASLSAEDGPGADDGPGGVATEEHVLAEGRRLFHTIGCVACHGALDSPAEVFDDPLLPGDVPVADVPAPFGDLRGKWRPGALARFLLEPTSVYPDGRMPSLDLTPSEADLIATYLSWTWGSAEPELEVETELAAWGREVFFKLGCGACHAVEGVPAFTESPRLARLTVPAPGSDAVRGCLDPESTGTPHYADLDTAALAAAVLAARDAVGAPAPIDEARRTLEDLSCLACHTMDGRGGPPEALRVYFTPKDDRVDLGDEGRLPPDLSDVGWRLTSTWMHALLVDGQRSRPYMATRMPSYGEARVGELPDQLARMAGVVPYTDVEEPESTDQLVLTGRQMMGRTALGCIACHTYKDYPPNGSPGLRITQLAERLRYEWYRSFMMNPQRYRPGSRMPDFGTGNASTLADVLDGDMRRQSDAMWCYFRLGERMPAPDGVEPTRGLEIVVDRRPVVMRAFLPAAGARGIAVGTPVGVHYAFDAEAVRLVDAWQGDFLDASGSWAGRGGNTLGGEGDVVWTAPPGPAFSFFDDPDHWPHWPAEAGIRTDFRFRGYRLDREGTPTFLYTLGPWHTEQGTRSAVHVEERITVEATPRLRIVRTFRFVGFEKWFEEVPYSWLPGIWFNAGPGRTSLRTRGDEGEWETPQAGRWSDDRAWFKVNAWDYRGGPFTVELEILP